MLTALALVITGPRTLDGWTCDAGGEPMRIVLRNDARIKTLWLCRLGEGNRAGDSVIPAGSTLRRSTTTYGDGLHDNDYWRVDVAEGFVFELDRLSLRHPTLNLDRQHRVLAFDSTTWRAPHASATSPTRRNPGFVRPARASRKSRRMGLYTCTGPAGRQQVGRHDRRRHLGRAGTFGKAYVLIRNRTH